VHAAVGERTRRSTLNEAHRGERTDCIGNYVISLCRRLRALRKPTFSASHRSTPAAAPLAQHNSPLQKGRKEGAHILQAVMPLTTSLTTCTRRSVSAAVSRRILPTYVDRYDCSTRLHRANFSATLFVGNRPK
jgi:hypothetical protein